MVVLLDFLDEMIAKAPAERQAELKEVFGYAVIYATIHNQYFLEVAKQIIGKSNLQEAQRVLLKAMQELIYGNNFA
ncbi:MAG: hypothetical protein QW328_08780 [Nitrososphaerota archaeon]